MVDPRGSFLTLAVPFYVVAVIIEVVWTKGRRYRLNDTISSLSAGVMSMLIGNLLQSLVLLHYVALRTFLEEKGLVLPVPYNTTTMCIAMLLAIDFAYYWAHRTAHESRLVWVKRKNIFFRIWFRSNICRCLNSDDCARVEFC
jgi:alkylglycerol monooxygenase